MAKLFFCSEGVARSIATRSSSSVRIAIGAIAIAARSAGSKRVFVKGDAPMEGTNAVRKAGSIIATDSVRIDGGSGPRRRA
jgi:hypothetical protein